MLWKEDLIYTILSATQTMQVAKTSGANKQK